MKRSNSPPSRSATSRAISSSVGRQPSSIEVAVLLDQNLGDDFARVRPLVDELVENASVGVLRSHAEPQHLDTRACDLLDDAWVVIEPPAAKDVQVAELARQHDRFVVVLAGQDGQQEPVVRICAAEMADAVEIGQPLAVAGVA